MGKEQKSQQSPNKLPAQPQDCRDAMHWFVDTVGLYTGSVRGLLASDFSDEQEPILEGAVITLKSRGVTPLVITGESLYQQSTHLWQQAVRNSPFGRPLVTNVELDILAAPVLIIKDLECPEQPHNLWYLYHHIIYPRAVSGKATLITTPLSYDEFVQYGFACEDFEFAGRKVTWEKLLWLLDACVIDLYHFRMLRAEGLAPMLKCEYYLFKALKERDIPVVPQQVLGDYMLDFAAIEKGNRTNPGVKMAIEVDTLVSLDSNSVHAAEAKKNLVLLSDGWRILRFTTSEILGALGACTDAAVEVWCQGWKKAPAGRLLSGQSATPIPELPGDDEVQKLAITYGGGPVAITGGAGTGKSSCIAHRVAYLIAQGVTPERILVLSHSTETLRPVKTAVENMIDKSISGRINFFAWHDLGLKILKENPGGVKRKPPLKVESNPQKVIQRLLQKHKKELDPVMLELSEELDEFTLSSLIALYKANLVTPKHVKERAKTDIDEVVAKVYQGYEDQLQKSNKVDRDDMISLCAQLIADNADIRARYQYQYDFVLIDDYQDATAAADLLGRLLSLPQDNLFIAGDEDESIYETKGGLPRLIGEVSLKLPNARCYVLEKNWRSHPVIVDHARHLISTLSRKRVQKEMVSGWGVPPTAAIVGPQMLATESAEAEWVADEIQLLLDSGRDADKIAVLYRYSRYSLIIEEALYKRGIRCLASHPEAGLIPDEVGDVMAFLKLVMDPDGPKARESFERVCQLRAKEVDPKLSSTIASFAEANNLSYLKAVEIYSEAVHDQSCQDLTQLVRIIRTMHQENLPPAENISLLRRTQRLNDYYGSVKVPPGVNYEPMRKLTQLEEDARKFKTVTEFVKAHIAKQPVAGKENEESYVHILTMHESKGREFEVVFMVGLSDGLFPSETANDFEEEKRLCYVGMTRVKELLYLSYPINFNDTPLAVSQFLLDARLITAQAAQSAAQMVPPLAASTAVQLPPGSSAPASVQARPVVAQAPPPQPKAEPAPQPKPEPAPQPKPEPAPQPKLEPAPQPALQPQPQMPPPQPEPVPQPAPQPQPQMPPPQPKLEPAPMPQPEPVPQPAPQPQPQMPPPQPKPEPAPIPQPVPPQPEPVPQPAPQPQPQMPPPQPKPEPAPIPQPEPVPQPAPQPQMPPPQPEPVPQPAPQPQPQMPLLPQPDPPRVLPAVAETVVQPVSQLQKPSSGIARFEDIVPLEATSSATPTVVPNAPAPPSNVPPSAPPNAAPITPSIVPPNITTPSIAPNATPDKPDQLVARSGGFMRLEHSLPPETPVVPRTVESVGKPKMPEIDFFLPDEIPAIPGPAASVSPEAPVAELADMSVPIAAPPIVPQQSADQILESLFGPAPASEAGQPNKSSTVNPNQIQKQVKAQMEAQQQALMQAQARANLRAQAQAARQGKPTEPVSSTTKDFEKPAAPSAEEAPAEPTGKKDRKRPGRKSKAQEEKERAAREKEAQEPQAEPQAEPQEPRPDVPALEPQVVSQSELALPRQEPGPIPSVLPSERPEIKSARDVASFLSEPIAEPKPEPPKPEPPAELSTYEQLQMGQHRFVNPIETTVKPKFAEVEPLPEPPKEPTQQRFPDIDWTTPADDLGSANRGQAPWDANSSGAVISQVPDQLWQQLSYAQDPEPKEPDVVYQKDFRDPGVPPEWNITGQRPQPGYTDEELKQFLAQPSQPAHLAGPAQSGYPPESQDPRGYPPQPSYPVQQADFISDAQSYPAPNIVSPPASRSAPAYEVYQPQLQSDQYQNYADPEYGKDPNAGVQYTEAQNDQSSFEAQTPYIESTPCRQCSAPMELGARFCGECGYKVEIKIRSCHLCGAPLDETAKFCGECGSKLAESSGVTISPVIQQVPTIQQPYAAGDEKPSQRGWVNKLIKFLDE